MQRQRSVTLATANSSITAKQCCGYRWIFDSRKSITAYAFCSSKMFYM